MERRAAPRVNQNERQYDDPASQLLSVYVSEAEPYDKAMVESWKGDMEGILIFAGLFSASVTAFIIESYKTLKPDSGDTMVALLVQISQQLTSISNGTHAVIPSPSPDKAPFKASASSIGVNVLWFLSLALALGTALSATLVQQWARNYLHMVELHPAPHKRARVRSYLFEGVEKFKVTAVVESIPTLLHIALLLFFVGLVVFLFPIHAGIAWLLLAILAVGAILYGVITILPVIYRYCPYQTPLSTSCWRISQFLGLLWYSKEYYSTFGIDSSYERIRGTLTEGRVLLATAESPGQRKRDRKALRWTLASLTDHAELEPFIANLPSYISSLGPSDQNMVVEELIQDGLVSRIMGLLASLPDSTGQELSRAIRRLSGCKNAMQAIMLYATPEIWSNMVGTPVMTFPLQQLVCHPNPTISTLANCMLAQTSLRLMEGIATQVRLGELFSMSSNDKAIQEICSLLPMDELDNLIDWGESVELTPDAMERTMEILDQEHVLNLLRAHQAHAETLRAYQDRESRDHIQHPLSILQTHDLAICSFVRVALCWLWAYDFEDRLGPIATLDIAQGSIPLLVRIVRVLRMRTSSGLWRTVILQVLHSFICNLSECGQLGSEDRRTVLETLDDIISRSHLSWMASAEPVAETNFISLLQNAVGPSPTVTLHKDIIEALLPTIEVSEDPHVVSRATSVVSDYLMTRPDSTKGKESLERLTSKVNRQLLRQLPMSHEPITGDNVQPSETSIFQWMPTDSEISTRIESP